MHGQGRRPRREACVWRHACMMRAQGLSNTAQADARRCAAGSSAVYSSKTTRPCSPLRPVKRAVSSGTTPPSPPGGHALRNASADSAPRVPLLKLSMNRTQLRSRGTVVPPDVTHTILRGEDSDALRVSSWATCSPTHCVSTGEDFWKLSTLPPRGVTGSGCAMPQITTSQPTFPMGFA